MIGAIFGDIVGSLYEWNNIKTTNFEIFNPEAFFTDDSVLTIALAESILSGTDYVKNLRKFYKLYPDESYGTSFRHWAALEDSEPYNSWGNGSAMRVSPIGFVYNTIESVLMEAKKSAEITHNHEEGIKGAQATAISIYFARIGKSKKYIKDFIESHFGYDLSISLDSIRPSYKFDVSCQGTVPPAIRAFLESDNFLHSIRLAVSLGGDSDTLACITGGIAHAYYGTLDKKITDYLYQKLDSFLTQITKNFCSKFDCF
ncbi:ADP-ribosylglycohydrolase family protein [Candidatus Lokiarchaeum ossiferum]|uniref:ADP-ribosylglycohydrolase family protein n=1 Tax=Candidatus Lokiarchaeum ossiferum TaxID=2951803 RepID=UPI00352F7E52